MVVVGVIAVVVGVIVQAELVKVVAVVMVSGSG